ncbi:MAG: MiaB/RimO family radical SAM methylthiotransferase, partial [Candidatus Peregrinibacteria bacterium]|nr:MiaB/RimO family radical SAM methylthiotransferase [Candidatus Peregrinibacteria bacterium]
PKILENFFKGKIKESMPECGESYFSIFPDTQNKVQVCVPIMTGCDKFCAYCIVPHTRGREVSRTMDEIFAECEKHVVAGAREITLLGQNVNSYTDGGRSSGKKCFPELLKRLDTLADKGLSRLRFTSPHPQDFNEDLIDVLAEMKTACPYIHLPVQHGSDRVLKAMNRHYTAADFEKIIKEVRKKIPNCTFSTDIIVGFPGETEKEFQELCEFAKRVKFDFSYTAIFSPRRGTPAAEMEGEFIDMKTKKRRFAEFDEIVKDIAFARRKEFVGKTLEVLVEKVEELENGNYLASGRSREFFEVWFESGRDWLGEIVEVEVTAQKYYVLHGKLK